MKKAIKSLFIISAVAALTAGVLAGCEAKGSGGKVVSYVSTSGVSESALADIVEEVQDSVVCITTSTVEYTWGQQYVSSGAGSGVIIESVEAGDGYVNYVITNNHVIDGVVGVDGSIIDNSSVEITTYDNESYSATVLATDAAGDIAIIFYTSAEQENAAVWGDSDKNRTGESVFAIGNPLGTLGGTVTAGIISSTARTITVNNYNMNLIQTDTAINPGNSGGALFNYDGELVGIVNAKTTSTDIEGICFAIPANDAKAIYTSLKNSGYVEGRQYLGFTLSQGTFGFSTVYYASYVNPGSAASSKGMTAGKFIVQAINGKTVSSLLDYHNILSALNIGDKVNVSGVDISGRNQVSIAYECEVEQLGQLLKVSA